MPIVRLLTPERRKLVRRSLDGIVALIGVGSIAALIAEFGFFLTWHQIELVDTIVTVFVTLFVIQELVRLLITPRRSLYFRERRLEIILILIIVLQLLFPKAIHSIGLVFAPELRIEQLALLSLAATQATLVISLVVRVLRYNHLVATVKLPPGALFIISFLLLVLGGTLLLMLPRATVVPLSFVDALFTATSAVCVTGLAVTDTAISFTPLGKAIILLLIQVGGLGIMTLTTFFALFFSGGISIRERLLISAVLSEDNIGEVSSILLRIALLTFSIEGIGAILLYIVQGGSFIDFDPYTLYYSIFHSVSAFCNAGFSLYSAGLYDEAIRTNYAYHSIIMALIVLGGLGFTVISELLRAIQLRKPRAGRTRYRISVFSKLALLTAAILLAGGTLVFFTIETQHSFREMTFTEQLFQSLFLSVTCRTAGFNIHPIEALSIPTALIMILLMWIGASPGSTGGGIKTTTIAIAVLNVRNAVLEQKHLEIFYRQVAPASISRAFAIILLSMLFVGGISVLLVYCEPDKRPVDLIFETVSAMATVGLTRNITYLLGDGGKLLITIAMFVGRVGFLTVLYAFVRPVGEARYKFPEENILVG